MTKGFRSPFLTTILLVETDHGSGAVPPQAALRRGPLLHQADGRPARGGQLGFCPHDPPVGGKFLHPYLSISVYLSVYLSLYLSLYLFLSLSLSLSLRTAGIFSS